MKWLALLIASSSNKRRFEMQTYIAENGKKKVVIGYDIHSEKYRASYIQIYNNGIEMEEQLLEMRSYNTLNGAKKWALKILGINS